jgi:hypothetical protein
MLARLLLACALLLSAGWTAVVAAIAVDPGLLERDGALPDIQILALSDEVDRLNAELAQARARPAAEPAVAATPAPAPTPAPTAEPAPRGSAPRTSSTALPRAAGAPPAPGEGRGPAHATEVAAEHALSAELGPPELPDAFLDVFSGIYEEPPTYRLEQGEALLHVAERFDVSVEELAAANGITDLDRVPVGMLLVIP